MKKTFYLVLIMLLAGCSAGHERLKLDAELYVGGLQGAENLTFDGRGNLYVTGLDGVIYLVRPAGPQGRVVSRAKLGRLCFGVVYYEGWVYAGVRRAGDGLLDGRIMQLGPDLSDRSLLTAAIPGLNGFALKDKYLYYTSSEGIFLRHGRVYRVNLDAANFEDPEIFADDLGWVNGLAFAADGQTLYYTEMFGGLWQFDVTTGEKSRIYDPGFGQIFDDLDVAPDGSLWVCFNSGAALMHFDAHGGLEGVYEVSRMGAPSACAFAGDPAFGDEGLYVTEFGRKGGSLKKDGRGVWLVRLPQ